MNTRSPAGSDGNTTPTHTLSAALPTTRRAGTILIAGSVALILTGLLHPPSGDSLLKPGHQAGVVWYLAHLLGVGIWPFFVAGVVLAGRELRTRSPMFTLFGVTAFVFAGANAIGAGLFGGFIRPRLADEYQTASDTARPTLAAVYHFNNTVNETLADAYQVGIGVAIGLLSISLIRGNVRSVLGWVGVLIGGLIAITFATGLLSVHATDFHVFVLVNLAIAAWIASLGAALIRKSATET